MRDSQLRYGPSRIDDTKIQERRETALVEVQTLTESRVVRNCSRRGTDVN